MNALAEGPLAWGLTREKHAELEAELSDHLYCLQGREGLTAAATARGRINSDAGRRALAGPHVAEQLAGTLGRWPTRQEWRELYVLLCWFAVIILSDALSLWANSKLNAHGQYWEPGFQVTPLIVWSATAAWLLQAVARAGFFASFAASLWRAWRLGGGVCLARILQLKLIHTVLVVLAIWLLGNQLWISWYDCPFVELAAPRCLTAPWICGCVLLLSAATYVLSHRRLWQVALALVFCAGFLYPAAPVPVSTTYYTRYLAQDYSWDANGVLVCTPSTNAEHIAIRAREAEDSSSVVSIDAAHNLYTMKIRQADGAGFHYHTWQSLNRRWSYLSSRSEPGGITLPLSAPGGGLGWLALPIPILGLIGLIAMAVVMGQRGVAEAGLYAALCFFAIVSTILPFAYTDGAYARSIVDVSPLGVLNTPLPGFESLLVGPDLASSWTLILGLLISAGIPWLVTGLFLRPRKTGLPTRGAAAE